MSCEEIVHSHNTENNTQFSMLHQACETGNFIEIWSIYLDCPYEPFEQIDNRLELCNLCEIK